MIIKKWDVQISFKNYEPQDEQGNRKVYSLGIIGILNMEGVNFIICITEKQLVGRMPFGINIYTIKNVGILPFRPIENNQKILNYIDGIKRILLVGFFFSYSSDLTISLQKDHQFYNNMQKNEVMNQQHHLGKDPRYFYNFNICQDFLYQKIDFKWYIPIIQGFVQEQISSYQGKDLKLLVISRRRHMRSGVRFLARGLDSDGNVANCVETEQII